MHLWVWTSFKIKPFSVEKDMYYFFSFPIQGMKQILNQSMLATAAAHHLTQYISYTKKFKIQLRR